ncbi:hypothetical protein AS29_014965 [Bacillus sp. SJS]|nr:hypothetical protein AS29_014965 [Bacillus sp. SJS]
MGAAGQVRPRRRKALRRLTAPRKTNACNGNQQLSLTKIYSTKNETEIQIACEKDFFFQNLYGTGD